MPCDVLNGFLGRANLYQSVRADGLKHPRQGCAGGFHPYFQDFLPPCQHFMTRQNRVDVFRLISDVTQICGFVMLSGVERSRSIFSTCVGSRFFGSAQNDRRNILCLCVTSVNIYLTGRFFLSICLMWI